MRVGIIKGYTFVTFVAYRRRLTPPLFNGEKAARKRLFDAPCRWAKRRLHTVVTTYGSFRNTLTAVARSANNTPRTSFHLSAFSKAW